MADSYKQQPKSQETGILQWVADKGRAAASVLSVGASYVYSNTPSTEEVSAAASSAANAVSSSSVGTFVSDRARKVTDFYRLQVQEDAELGGTEVKALLAQQIRQEDSPRRQVAEQQPDPVAQQRVVERAPTSAVPIKEVIVTTTGTAAEIAARLGPDSEVNSRGEAYNLEKSTGLVPKPDLTATLSLFSLTGQSRNVDIREFFITGVREDTNEKFQIVQTFGSDYVFFFNRRPLVYTINGIFYNTQDKQWRNDFRDNYDRLFRGTELVRRRNKAVMVYDDVVREGYLLSLSYNTESANPNAVPFTFSMYVTSESRIGLTSGPSETVAQASAALPEETT